MRRWFRPRGTSSAPVWWLRLQRQRRKILFRRNGNPLFWLHQRTWTSRATKWGWCGVILIAEIIDLFIRPARSWFRGQMVIGAGLVVGMIYASATSYRLEKRNGMVPRYNLGVSSAAAVVASLAILGIVGFLTLAGLRLQMNERSLGYLHPHRSRRHHRRHHRRDGHSKKPLAFAR